MKGIAFCISFIMIMANFTNAQDYYEYDEEYSVEELKEKVKKYTSMKNGGLGLVIGGSTLLVVGTALFISSISSLNDISQDPDDDYGTSPEERSAISRMAVGWVAIGFGIPLTVAGSVVGSIGAKKQREYEFRLGNVSRRFELKLIKNGLSLQYNF